MAARPGDGARSARGRASAAIQARPVLVRWILAGPATMLAALATMAAMPLWLPAGAACINHLALPILLTPLLWAVPFFYACLTEDLPRASLVFAAVILVQVAAVLIVLSS